MPPPLPTHRFKLSLMFAISAHYPTCTTLAHRSEGVIRPYITLDAHGIDAHHEMVVSAAMTLLA